MTPTDIRTMLERITQGTPAPGDIEALLDALVRGTIRIETGERGVGIGGDAPNALIITGDGNVVHQGVSVHAIIAELRQVFGERWDELTAPRRAAPIRPADRINPFSYGAPIPPDRFYGRDAQRREIKGRIGGITAQGLVLAGTRRSGKSSLLRYVHQRLHEFCPPEQKALSVLIDMQDGRFGSPLGLVEALRRGIEKGTGSAPWLRQENDDPWSMDDGLAQVRDAGFRVIVLLDEFEMLGKRLHEFAGWGDDWRAKMTAGYFVLVIAASRPLEEIYQQCNLSSPFNNVLTYTHVAALQTAEWQQLIHDGFALHNEQTNAADLALIRDLAGGMPFYTQMAAALLWQHGDHATVEQHFAEQAQPRFQELWDDCTAAEQRVLRAIAGVPNQPAVAHEVQTNLIRRGILRPDGQLFSRVFAPFVRGAR